MTSLSNSGLMCGCAICAQQGLTDSGASSAPYALASGAPVGINHPLKWGSSDTLGTSGGVVTWSIVAGGTPTNPTYIVPPTTTSLSSFLYSGFEAQLRAAFDAWAAVANISFIQVSDGGGVVGNDATGNFADIRITAIPFDGPNGTLAQTYFPDQGAIGGDMFLDAGDGAFFNTHSLFLVAAHEIGHAIGLDHADPMTNPGSLMNGTYNDSLNGLTADDISGAQAIYGAAQGGAKVYTMPTGQNSITIMTGVANFTVNGNSAANTINGSSLAETIVGAGGNDTINAGAGDDTIMATHSDGNDTYTGGTGWDILDFTSVNGVVQINQLDGIVTGSAGNDTLLDTFEQISGSNFDDVLSGGHGINCLDGNGGNDLFFGNGGDDLLRGGDGNDTIVCNLLNDGSDRWLGGNGFDTIDYSTLGAAVQVNQAAGTTTGTAGNDQFLDSFEQIIGSNFGDTIIGDSNANTFKGNGGNDTISGGDGDDFFICTLSDGNDTYTGGNGWDILDFTSVSGVVQIDQLNGITTGSAGNDILLDTFEQISGSNFDDVLSGGHGINCLDGNGGNDLFFGNGGDDLLRGGDGNDTIMCNLVSDGDDRWLGGNGFDTVDYSTLGGAVQVNQTTGTTTGAAGNDTFLDVFERIIGSDFNDTLTGDSSATTLWGGGGADTIQGNGGADSLLGGAGNDTFIFTTGDGADTIGDFVAGAGSDDVINLHAMAGFTNFAQVQAVASQVGANTVLTFGGGDTITFTNVTASNLHQDDFTFV